MAMTITEALQRAFDKSGLTYEEFAGLAKISLASAHRKLNGEQPISLVEAEGYAKLLRVKISCQVK